jgi:trimethylamine---corrinoid protein Co-methyltransferase
MNFMAQVLSPAEQARVDRESRRILAEVGVKYYGKQALKLLKKNGAQVDEASQTARLPAALVQEALAAAPKAFVLGARNPAYDYALPSPTTRYGQDGTGSFVVDFVTGERRYGTVADITSGLRVFHHMDMGVMAWVPTCASNVPAHSRPLHEFFAMMRATSKHGQHELHLYEQAPYLAAGLKAVLGSEAAVRARKNYSLIYCPVAPLMHDGDMLDAYLDLGDYDMPVMIMPMPVNGTTGPASLFSNLSLANAEVLSGLVVFQLRHPGRPVIYSSAMGSVDFKTGGYLGGTPEMALQSAAMVTMGRYYGLPATSAGCTADAKQTGPEAVLEKLLTTLPAVSVGASIIVGLGEIESDQTLVLEQLVVDNEIAHLCDRIYAGVDASAAKDLLEDVARVGPGGNFLKSRNTRQAAHSDEFYRSALFDRHGYEAWVSLGRPTLYSNAREKVTEILARPLVDPLPEAVSRELDAILAAADRELASRG